MALTIIHVTGPADTHKSRTIREFAAKFLKHTKPKANGDVLGVFYLPQRKDPFYAVGVHGSGDSADIVEWGLEFLNRYQGLRAMIVATRSEGATLEALERFADDESATILPVITKKLPAHKQLDAIKKNVARIRRLMPR